MIFDVDNASVFSGCYFNSYTNQVISEICDNFIGFSVGQGSAVTHICSIENQKKKNFEIAIEAELHSFV